MNNNLIYIVVGAPRSGTSALSLVLQEQGIGMFMSSDAPDQDSPSGNQEDNIVRLINNRLMGRNDNGDIRDWDNPIYVGGASVKAIRLIQAYIQLRRNHASGTWGVKDPRTCFLIEAWNLATNNLSVQWIHIYREDRDAILRSLIKMLPPKIRNCNDPKTLYRLVSNWHETYRVAIELGFTRTGIEPITLSYEELLTTEGQARIAQVLNFTLPFRCINPSLNRQGSPLKMEKPATSMVELVRHSNNAFTN